MLWHAVDLNLSSDSDTAVEKGVAAQITLTNTATANRGTSPTSDKAVEKNESLLK